MSVKWNEKLFNQIRLTVKESTGKGRDLVKEEALRLIFQTAKTGRIYRRGGRVHQASAPEEPFANDTGNAVNQIRTYDYELEDMFSSLLSAEADYASYLEFGTEKMAARPVFRPAAENTLDEIASLIQSDILKVLKSQ